MAQSHPDMMWLPVIGLDRHTPMIGRSRVAGSLRRRDRSPGAKARVQEAIYRPISDFVTAE